MLRIKKVLHKFYFLFSNIFFDPWDMIKRWNGLFYFIRNSFAYSRKNNNITFKIFFHNLYYRSYDRYASAGMIPTHYFLQDIWTAKCLHSQNMKHVIDIGSRLDGYIAHLLIFCKVTYVDIRPLSISVENLNFISGNITELPFKDGSISCLSSLHVIEHIGLGRYGDSIDPNGHIKAAEELKRVLAPEGLLLISTVLGREKLRFDAHRIFDPETIRSMFHNLILESFNLIDDRGEKVQENATFADAKKCNYGCGIFIFKKPKIHGVI